MAKGNIFNYERVRSPDMTEQMKLIDTVFAVGKPYTLTTATTLATTDLGKKIRVNSANAQIITLPAVGADEDGGMFTFIKQGAGGLTITAGASDYISSYSSATGSDITSSEYAAISYEYVDGLTRWVAISHEGTWAST